MYVRAVVVSVAWLSITVGCGQEPPVDGAITAPATGNPGGVVSIHAGTAGGGRAPNIPADYVATALGYMHPSCIVTLSAGEQVAGQTETGTQIQGTDGALREIPRCGYPAFRNNGALLFDDSEPVANNQNSGDLAVKSSALHLAFGSTQPAVAVKALRSTWTVPFTRADEDNPFDTSQIAIWPGLENAAPSTWVLQPILQLFASPPWEIKNCYFTSAGQFLCSSLVNVNPGDLISGTVTGSNCSSGTGVCSTWTVAISDLSTGQSAPPFVVNSFTGVARRVIAADLEIDTTIHSCLELPMGYPANLATEWQNFSNVWSSGAWTNRAQAPTIDCKYGSWVAPKGTISSVYLGWWTGYMPYALPFDAFDDRVYLGLADWAGGQYKSECDAADAVVGLSANPSTLRAHSVLCTYNGNVNSKLLNPSFSVAVDFSNTSRSREAGSADWDVNFFKGECAANEAVSGVAQSTDGKLTKVLCTRMYQRTKTGTCYRRIFSTGDNRGNTAGDPDWAFQNFKGQCDSPGNTTVVKGVSRFTTTGQAHAILCCPTAFTP